MDYHLVASEDSEKYCIVHEFPEEIEDIHMPAEGIEMGELFPGRATLRMSKEERGIVVPDFIPNTLGYWLCGAGARDVLRVIAIDPIEYLAFDLLNHKGRKSKGDFFIVNPIGTVDCIDAERTVGDIDTFPEESYSSFDVLYLDPAKIDPKRTIFRLEGMPESIIVRDDVRSAIESAGLTGIRFYSMGEVIES